MDVKESVRRMKRGEKLQGLCVVTLPILLLRESTRSLRPSSQRMDDFHSHTRHSTAEKKSLQEASERQPPPPPPPHPLRLVSKPTRQLTPTAPAATHPPPELLRRAPSVFFFFFYSFCVIDKGPSSRLHSTSQPHSEQVVINYRMLRSC